MGGSAIPHPIFSKIQIDFSHLANILFARSPRIQEMLASNKCAASFEYEPKNVRFARDLLVDCIGKRLHFTLKLSDGKNKVILLNFCPEDRQVWSCTLTMVNRSKCVSYTSHSVRVIIKITNNVGIFLNALSFNILLFYTNNLKLRIFEAYPYFDEPFYAAHVDFYVPHPPKCNASKPLPNILPKRKCYTNESLIGKMKIMRCE
jgi:hypothetical protein